MNYKMIDQNDIDYFASIVAADDLQAFSAVHDDYTHDEMTEYGRFAPEVVIKATDTQQISKIMAYCYKHDIPVTPRGSGTGLCGGCVALNKGVVLSLEKMNKIIEIDKENLVAVCEPGVLLMELAAEAASAGFLYAPDPGEKSATIGGNVMTNAGGMRAVRYGVTRDYVRGMEVVLANGEIIELGGKIAKNSSGYSLKDLMIGSEGTLGIITKVYLKLLAKPMKMISLLIPFNDLRSCLQLVPKIMALPNQPTTLEFCEKEVILDASKYLNKQFPSKDYAAYLIVSYSGNTKEDIEKMYQDTANLCLDKDAIDVYISDTDERQESIWNARGAFLEAIKSSTTTMDECDVVVDIDKIYPFLSYVKDLADQYQVRIRNFGHAGDGNLHCYVCKDDIADDAWPQIVNTCMQKMYDKAKELNGLTSGEHGIGHAKKRYLSEALGETQIELMKRIKSAFDPRNILNPGKII